MQYYSAKPNQIYNFLKSLPICELSKTCVVSNEPSVKALANELGDIVADTALLPTQRFARSPARATFVADTNFTQKMFLILFRNILCPQQMFPSLRNLRNIMGNNVSSLTRAFIYFFTTSRAARSRVQAILALRLILRTTALKSRKLIKSVRRLISFRGLCYRSLLDF